MPAGVVPHQLCLLVWCFSIGHACWNGTSLKAMPAGPLPLQQTITSQSSADGRRMVRSLMLSKQRCHYIRHVCWSSALLDMPAFTVQLYQTCVLDSFIQMNLFIKYFSIRLGIWSNTNPPDMPTGKVPLPWVCKTCWLPTWTPSWIYRILSDAWIASLCCYKDDVWNSIFSKIILLHANPLNLPVSGKIFLNFCNKLPSWQPSCLYSYLVFF